MFVNREGLVDDVGVRENLGHSDCKIVELLILRGVRGQLNYCYPGLMEDRLWPV